MNRTEHSPAQDILEYQFNVLSQNSPVYETKYLKDVPRGTGVFFLDKEHCLKFGTVTANCGNKVIWGGQSQGNGVKMDFYSEKDIVAFNIYGEEWKWKSTNQDFLSQEFQKYTHYERSYIEHLPWGTPVLFITNEFFVGKTEIREGIVKKIGNVEGILSYKRNQLFKVIDFIPSAEIFIFCHA